MVVDLLSPDADRLFAALGDRTRRDILTRVLREEQSVSALARHFPVSLTAVQKHVAVLVAADLVSKRRHGREQLVSGNPATLRDAAALLDALEQTWRHRLDAIDDLLSPPTNGARPLPVTDVNKDLDALTLTMTADYDAPVERVWQVWSDPQLIQRWWGPPTYPATFTDHELAAGHRSPYFMTGPEGDQHHGWMEFREVDEPKRIVFTDGFCSADGQPDPTLPVSTSEITFEPRADGGTRLVLVGRYQSREDFERVLEMGMEQGMTQAVGQIDALLS